MADLINAYPDRFIFGSDSVAPKDQTVHQRVFHLYDPLWPLLTKEASFNVRKGNYERIFDEAKPKVRRWETAQGFASIEASSTNR
jgi:hypothetical protein